MGRISKFQHRHQTLLSNNPAYDISANFWNDVGGTTAHLETGMFGFPLSVNSVSLNSNVITPVDSLTIVKAATGTTDNLNFIDTTGNNDKDLIWFLPFSGHTITVNHNAASPPANTGPIILLSGTNTVINANNPMLLIRNGTTFYEIAPSTAIVNGNIAANAGIVYGKLNLTGSLLNSDISVSAAIDPLKINGTAGVLNGNQTWTGLNKISANDIKFTTAGNGEIYTDTQPVPQAWRMTVTNNGELLLSDIGDS